MSALSLAWQLLAIALRDWIASIPARRTRLACAYAHLQYLTTSDQWKVDYAGPRWWEVPSFTLEEIVIEGGAYNAVENAREDLPFLLRLGVRYRSTSVEFRRGWVVVD